LGECLFATFSAPEKVRIDKDDEVVVTLQGETLQKTPMQGGTLLKNHFFQKSQYCKKNGFLQR
jgi:hypothetical protein